MCSPVWKALTPARSRRCSLLLSHSDIIRWYGGRLSPQLSLLYVILSGISEKLTITDCYLGVWGYVLAQNSADSAEIRHTVTSFPQLITDVLQESVSAQRISAFLQRADVQYLDESEGTSDVAKDDEPLIVVGDIAWHNHKKPILWTLLHSSSKIWISRSKGVQSRSLLVNSDPESLYF